MFSKVFKYLEKQYRYIEHLTSFYQILAGFVALQCVSYFLGIKAEEHSLISATMIRLIFFGL